MRVQVEDADPWSGYGSVQQRQVEIKAGDRSMKGGNGSSRHKERSVKDEHLWAKNHHLPVKHGNESFKNQHLSIKHGNASPKYQHQSITQAHEPLMRRIEPI